jgi:YcxB-like protein
MEGPRVAAGTAPVRDPPFELTFRVEARDYQAFLRKLRWRAIERVVSFLSAVGLGVVAGVIGYFVSLAFGKAGPAWGWAIAVGSALILYLVYRLTVMRSYHRSFFAGQSMALGETKVVADTRGIGANVAEVVLAMPWSRIIRVVETDRHVFLMFARLAGVIVPKRAFTSADQAKRFTAFARSMAPSAGR